MKNIEKMLSDCGIAYEVLSENDKLNKLANTLRKKTIFDMLKDDRTLFFLCYCIAHYYGTVAY